MANWYLNNPLIHENRRRGGGVSKWQQSFAVTNLRPLIICRGPIRMEAMTVFEEMGIQEYGILLSEKDSITYPNALSPELRKQLNPDRVHRVQDYTGASKEERQDRIQQIIAISKRHHYDAVFAGYGFMAEDEEMVISLERAGLLFIGPQSMTHRKAGRKDLAKRTALEVSVSVTPGVDNATVLTLLNGYPEKSDLQALLSQHQLDVNGAEFEDAGSIQDQAELVLNASYDKRIDLISIDEISAVLTEQVRQLFVDNPGRRIRLKAIGGGGGKGQRILRSPDQFAGTDEEKLAEAVTQVAPLYLEVLAEVKANGEGDNKNVLAELNIETVRHQEIQVVGNGDWCITMGGRDCSVQMNEQKLLEISVTQEELDDAIASAEDPATQSALERDRQILARMEEEAARFGAAVGLNSVSTFECIVDGDRHFFMEMNTRVQVEHRVTELCYGLQFVNPEALEDSFTVNSIVELMVLLAVHGSRMPKPHRVPRQRASVEVRLNATDRALKPHAGGVIAQWSENLEGEIRDDQGICMHNPDTDVFMKYHLAGAYDSNIALLLSVGDDKSAALEHMAEILRRTRMSGENLKTNLQFQYGLLNWILGQHPQARPGTNFVMPYLTAVGRLAEMASNMDIVQAYDAIGTRYAGQLDAEAGNAVADILNRKSSLLARTINALFAEPHFLAGWLSLNRENFDLDDGISWCANPISVLKDLYHYLNMDGENGEAALYVIWDHDKALLDEAISFYDTVYERLGTDDWRTVESTLTGEALEFGEQADAVRAAHAGYQVGLEILLVLPYVGLQTGFFDLKVMPDLSVSIPLDLMEAEAQSNAVRVLSPPPALSADEITAPSGGMFYAREAPDREPYMQAGQHFEVGEPLFIIEVMKMFNKVHAPFSGTVDKVLIDTDATIVKRGQSILEVTPDDEIEVESEDDLHRRVQEQTQHFLEVILEGNQGAQS